MSEPSMDDAPASAVTDLEAELDAANEAAARAAVGCVPLHAAAVARGGSVIALTGQSHSGKSTLAAAAVLAGDAYVADEVTAVDPDTLAVRPFHRPIGLRTGGAAALGIERPATLLDAAVYPWQPGPDIQHADGGTLAGIALVGWDASVVEPVIIDVPPALALTKLTQHTVVLDDAFAEPFELLTRLVRAVPVASISYATTAQSLELLDELFTRWSS